ncbi:MAG: hypothetical protein IPP87_24795 [Ideonella sp.]|nr:hypothetical protein [Ideonella sp.]
MIALRRLLWACCLGLATGGVLAQTTAAPAFDRARLDAFMQALSRHDQALGSVAIALPGQPLYTAPRARPVPTPPHWPRPKRVIESARSASCSLPRW